ncbi:sugar phosphate isomerase/epimerase [Opitutales bacterium]|jgi:L-ribulose-5-phosphate 3-epimerase|nr:sugar phosphate isomerase/epimerase [Opitutales bacterium]
MNKISFITANFVARELGYELTEGWHQGNNATNDYFRSIDTFPKRFDALLKEINRMGFQSIDLWVSHLHWAWATKEHSKIANSLINKHRLRVASMVGNFGATRLELEAACQVANAMEIRLLAGSVPFLRINRDEAVTILRDYGLEFAQMNQKEESADQLLKKIGYDNHDILGIAIDTGWYQVLKESLFDAFEELAPNLKLVQLKDVVAMEGNTTCIYEKGVIPVHQCIQKLQEIRFNGSITVEHHPFDRNPAEECQHNFELLRSWLTPQSQRARIR